MLFRVCYPGLIILLFCPPLLCHILLYYYVYNATFSKVISFFCLLVSWGGLCTQPSSLLFFGGWFCLLASCNTYLCLYITSVVAMFLVGMPLYFALLHAGFLFIWLVPCICYTHFLFCAGLSLAFIWCLGFFLASRVPSWYCAVNLCLTSSMFPVLLSQFWFLCLQLPVSASAFLFCAKLHLFLIWWGPG